MAMYESVLTVLKLAEVGDSAMMDAGVSSESEAIKECELILMRELDVTKDQILSEIRGFITNTWITTSAQRKGNDGYRVVNQKINEVRGLLDELEKIYGISEDLYINSESEDDEFI